MSYPLVKLNQPSRNRAQYSHVFPCPLQGIGIQSSHLYSPSTPTYISPLMFSISPLLPCIVFRLTTYPLYSLVSSLYSHTSLCLLHIPSTPLHGPFTPIYLHTLLHIPSTPLYRLYTPTYPRTPLHIPSTPLYRLCTPIYSRALYICPIHSCIVPVLL